jgi:hypothetical protein
MCFVVFFLILFFVCSFIGLFYVCNHIGIDNGSCFTCLVLNSLVAFFILYYFQGFFCSYFCNFKNCVLFFYLGFYCDFFCVDVGILFPTFFMAKMFVWLQWKTTSSILFFEVK